MRRLIDASLLREHLPQCDRLVNTDCIRPKIHKRLDAFIAPPGMLTTKDRSKLFATLGKQLRDERGECARGFRP